MKAIEPKWHRFIIITVFGITFCSCTENVYINITAPAVVSIPGNVKRIGIVNRSIISDSNKVRRTIDEVLSVKGPKLDSESGKECISGMKAALIQSNIFPKVVFLDSVHLINSFPDAFPPPLSWTKIQEICQKYHVDVLFLLELFHTHTNVNVLGSASALFNAGVGTLANGPSEGTIIKDGWRIYDPQSRTILDEFPFSEDWTTSLRNHQQTIKGASYNMGQTYAARVIPYETTVWREFYTRGGGRKMVMARRMADAGDWNGAAQLWKEEISNTKRRVSAKAYYNLAISEEVNGNIDSAIVLVQKAYEIKGKYLALQYLNQLQDRAVGNQILNTQAH